jgi:hypothetical protein
MTPSRRIVRRARRSVTPGPTVRPDAGPDGKPVSDQDDDDNDIGTSEHEDEPALPTLTTRRPHP